MLTHGILCGITILVQNFEPQRIDGEKIMSFDYSKLIGRIIEFFNTRQAFAEAMGWSNRTCSLKLNNALYWKQPEIEKAIVLLHLSKSDIPTYFFTEIVQNFELRRA